MQAGGGACWRCVDDLDAASAAGQTTTSLMSAVAAAVTAAIGVGDCLCTPHPPALPPNSPPCARDYRSRRPLVFCCCFLFLKYFIDFCQTYCLFNICRTDIHEIRGSGRTLAADERSEVIFFRAVNGRYRDNQLCGQNQPPFHTS